MYIEETLDWVFPTYGQGCDSSTHPKFTKLLVTSFSGSRLSDSLASMPFGILERISTKSQMRWGPWRSSDPAGAGLGAPSVPAGELRLGEKWFALRFSCRSKVRLSSLAEAPRQALASRVEHLEKAGCTQHGGFPRHAGKERQSQESLWHAKVSGIRQRDKAIRPCLCRKALEAEATSRHEEWGVGRGRFHDGASASLHVK